MSFQGEKRNGETTGDETSAVDNKTATTQDSVKTAAAVNAENVTVESGTYIVPSVPSLFVCNIFVFSQFSRFRVGQATTRAFGRCRSATAAGCSRCSSYSIHKPIEHRRVFAT